DWERNIIIKNMDKLVNLTSAHSLLPKLRANGVLGEDDLEELNKPQSSRTPREHGSNRRADRCAPKKQTKSGASGLLLTEIMKRKHKSFRDDREIEYEENEKLGEGSAGTIVYKGKFGDRDVAVKRVNSDQEKQKTIVQEIENLKIGDVHENIVRYFCTKVVQHFVLIVLELCDMTLTDWVYKQVACQANRTSRPSQLLGLDWLHAPGLSYRDLKPENILLVAQINKVKISDFGLSRKILETGRQQDPYYVTQPALGLARKGGSLQRFFTNSKSPKNTNSYSMTNRAHLLNVTFESDVFSLGCVYYYVLTDGSHAFGSVMRRNVNILDDNVMIDTNNVVHGCTQNTLFIRLMISNDPKSRPSCSALLSSPIFWTHEQCVKFSEHLKTIGVSKQMKFKPSQPCRLDHWVDTVSKREKPCAAFAYAYCQGVAGLRQYYPEQLFAFEALGLELLPAVSETHRRHQRQARKTSGATLDCGREGEYQHRFRVPGSPRP
ncbi:Serine/threonine-protein kinase/endoribonuclease IRE1, partial [Orchesella cincta]